MTAPLYGIFGCGGFGREGIELARETCLREHGSDAKFELCFIEHRPAATFVDGYPVLSIEQFAQIRDRQRYFNILIANSDDRVKIAKECETLGLTPFTIRSRTAEVHATATIGEGAVLCQYSLVSANARVGRFFHLNHHSYVSHDCTVGDFVTFAPAVRCNGTVQIEDFAYLGSGAVIRNGMPGRHMRIGRRAIIGMGAIVVKPVPEGVTVVGNPARPLARPRAPRALE